MFHQAQSVPSIIGGNTDIKPIHPAIFNELNVKCIRSAVYTGVAGSSGVDAHRWRKLFVTNELHRALAATAR